MLSNTCRKVTFFFPNCKNEPLSFLLSVKQENSNLIFLI